MGVGRLDHGRDVGDMVGQKGLGQRAALAVLREVSGAGEPRLLRIVWQSGLHVSPAGCHLARCVVRAYKLMTPTEAASTEVVEATAEAEDIHDDGPEVEEIEDVPMPDVAALTSFGRTSPTRQIQVQAHTHRRSSTEH